MALWDYHVSGGPSFVGVSDERLASLRAQYPRGRAVESVHHLPRRPGDDETDHILRNRYGIDPASYRATFTRGRPVTDAELDSYERGASRPSRSKSRSPRSASSRSAAPRSARVRPRSAPSSVQLFRLVKLALRESPSLERRLSTLVRVHQNGRKESSRHSFIGFPLVIRSTRSGLSIAFASER